jgi:thioesterase domain-containing protein
MAFEVAQRLQERDGAVEAVLLFDTWAIAPQQIALRKLRQDWKHALNVLSADQPSQSIGSRLTTLCLLILWILRNETRRLVRETDWLLPLHKYKWFRSLFSRAARLELVALLDEQGTPLNSQIIEELYNKASQTPSLRRLDCPGILFRAGTEDQRHHLARDGGLGWENLFAGGLEIIPVLGDHLTMIREASHKLMLSRDLNEVLGRLCARLNGRHHVGPVIAQPLSS